MHKAIMCVFLVAALMLTGCISGTGTGSVEELLRAPQPTELVRDVQVALNEYLNGSAQLKYPRGNRELSPILLSDLDADGEEEAMVLYTAEATGQNVCFAVLENIENTWVVAHEVVGLSSEVMDLELVQMSENCSQVVVGYANATLVDKYLCVYDYTGDEVLRLLELPYLNYTTAELNNDGVNSLIVVSSGEEEGALTAQLIDVNDMITGMELLQSFDIDDRFVSCSALHYVNSGGTQGFIVEGNFANGWIANEVFKYMPETGEFEVWPKEEVDVPLASLRYQTELTATIVDNSEIPRVPANVTKITTFNNPTRFYYVIWQDYLGEMLAPSLSGSFNDGFMHLPQNESSINGGNGQQPQDDDEATTQEQDGTEGADRGVIGPQEGSGTAQEQNGEDEDEDTQTQTVVHPLDEIVTEVLYPVQPYFGIYDSHFGYFATLPQSWSGKVVIAEADGDGWTVKRREDNALLAEFQITQEEIPTGDFKYVETVSQNDIYVSFGDACEQEEMLIIREGVVGLQ